MSRDYFLGKKLSQKDGLNVACRDDDMARRCCFVFCDSVLFRCRHLHDKKGWLVFNPDLQTTDDRDLVRCRHSHLETFRRSPSLFYAKHIAKTVPNKEPSPEMRIGLAVDMMLLQHRDDEIVVMDEKLSKSRSAASKKEKDEIKKAECWLSEDDFKTAKDMVAAARRHQSFSGLLNEPYVAQKRIEWVCQWEGFPKRGTLDFLRARSLILDLKTTSPRHLHPKFLGDYIEEYGIHRQLAMYQEGVHRLTGELLPVKLAFIGNEQPHDVVVLDLDGDELALGWKQNQKTCHELADAFAYNDFQARLPTRVQFSPWHR